MQIIVLGMHRSGTSVITRILNLMGAYLGSKERLGKPCADNPRGFFERDDVLRLNNQALSDLGFSWDLVKKIDSEIFASKIKDDFLAKAKEIVEEMDHHQPWVIKDPRLSILLPLWLPLLKNPCCVYAYRSPLEVARSLQARNGLPEPYSMALWEAYNQSALAVSQGLPKVFVSYEILIEQPMAAIKDLYSRLCGLGLQGITMPTALEIEENLDAGLRHHHFSPVDLDRVLTQPQKELWLSLQQGGKGAQMLTGFSSNSEALLEWEKDRRSKELEFKKARSYLQSQIDRRDSQLESFRLKDSEQAQTLQEHAAQQAKRNCDLLQRRERELSAQLKQTQKKLQALLQGKEEQLTLLKDWLSHIHHGYGLLLNSMRWRVGNWCVRMVERLLWRPHPVLVADRIQEILDGFAGWRNEIGNNSVAPVAGALGDSPLVFSARKPVTDNPGYDVIMLANVDWHTRFQRPHQLAKQFALHGHRVFYVVASNVLVDPESPPYTAYEVSGGVYEVQLSGNKQVNHYASILDSSTTKKFTEALDALRNDFDLRSVACHIHLSFWTPLGMALRDRFCWRVLYDCMDEWAEFPNIDPVLVRAEKALVQDSDLVTVTGSILHKKWQPESKRCELVRNGVDFDFFKGLCVPNNLLTNISHPIIGFYGALAEWVDFGLIQYLAEQRPEWNIVLVGDIFVDSLASLRALSNVHLLGHQPYRSMPGYLYHFDVCMIPFRLYHVTHAVDPVKLYEFLSAGKPVVSVPLDELRIYEDYLYFGESREDFLRQVDNALMEKDLDKVERRKGLARQNDWTVRYEKMHKATVEFFPLVSIIVVTYQNVELSKLCVESVLQNTEYPNFELIIVDNASTDGTANYLHYIQGLHRVKILRNEENTGFAPANNQGLAMAEGDFFILLNNDTVVPRGWLLPLLKQLQDKKIGLVGPVTNFVGNEAKIQVPYHSVADMPEFARSHMASHVDRSFDINVLAMFCVAMTRVTFVDVGPLDEGFRVGMFEDDDYSYRMHKKGYRTVCVEGSFVHHFGQAAFKKLLETGEYHNIWKDNQDYFEKKWGKWKAHKSRALDASDARNELP